MEALAPNRARAAVRGPLLLAHPGKEGEPEAAILKITQEILAEKVDTTRSRVSFL